MKEQQNNRISSGVVAAISAVVVAVGAGVAFYSWSQSENPPAEGTRSAVQPSPQPTPTNAVPNEQTAQIFWLRDTGTKLELVPQAVAVPSGEPNQVLTAAFKSLLAGPTENTESSTIPKETQLLGVKVENDGVHVNLSEDFTTGGGSSSMIGRVGQVVYTATTLDNNAKVFIEVNGQPLEVLGGEGLELEQPLTRQSFNENFPL
ncbi:MAG: GerMN domain-containing protein [Scytonema sp. PMC 1069.18]|nr:GerMN domain-containing protein [Scytonema sp. PMC 1069.18]MEC4887417.1 GerMN domain-containing protein [Scytonema sp. PMC 1070.18]